MSVKIQLRRDISSVWTSRNPILALGEPGFETDTHKLKIGDGTTAWNSLNYISDGFSGVGGPLDYTYMVSFSENTFVANYDSNNVINNLRINPTSHDIDFSLYYDDLISNSYAINMTLTQVEDADKAILFKCNHIVDLRSSVPPQPYYSFDVTELSRSELFTVFENTKKYYLNIDIKGDSAKFQIASVYLSSINSDHDGGSQTAQVLQFDNADYQSVITGPTPPSGNSAKRIIVQGQRAEGGGEGGDVYVWGGDSDANGGDIKIYAGDADNVSPDSGNGGYVNIDGGKGATTGGNVEITGGYSEGGEAGDVIIAGGPTSSGVAGTVNIKTNNDNGSFNTWTFSPEGNLTLPSGSIISETNNTLSLMPPTAVAGQSLVIRPTQTWSLTSNHPSGFAPGDSITITFTPNNGSVGSWTASYTFTGCTEEQLGRSLTGSLVYTAEETQSLTWTIPSISTITSFTFTIQNVAFPLNADPFITLSSTGSISNEPSHLHLVAGDPTTVDLFLGDDDQYVKIEKNGGDVVIGTNSDTNHWTFGTDASLTLPVNGSIICPSTLTYYVMANDDGYTVTSSDGLNWNGPYDLNMSIHHVATNDTTIVAIAGNDRIGYTSFSNPSATTPIFATVSDITNIELSQIIYGGGYFVVAGKGFGLDGVISVPLYGYSSDGSSNWTFKIVEGELATKLDRTNISPFARHSCEFSDIDYNGTGWNFAVMANHIGGGVYTTDITETFNNSNFFGMVAGQQVAWNGSSWYIINSDDGSAFNPNVDPRINEWDGPYNPWGSYQEDLGINITDNISDTFCGGNGYLAFSDGDGHISFSSDNGVNWTYKTPIPYTATITNISLVDNKYQLTLTGVTSHENGEKITISGSSVTGYNGTYFLDDSNFLYTTFELNTPWTATISAFSGTANLTWSHGEYIDAMDYVNGYFYIGNDDEQIARSNDLINWTIVDDRNNAFEYWNDFSGYSSGATGDELIINGNEIIFNDGSIQTTAYIPGPALTDIAGLTPTDNNVIIGDGTNFVLESGDTLRTSLGLAIGSQVQAYDDDLTAIAGLTSAADKGIQFTGAGTASTFDLTTAGKALLDDVDASAQRTTLGLAIGSQVQAYDDDLTAIAGLTSAADKGIQFTGAGTASTFDLTTAGKALLDDVDASAQRTTLGLAIGSQVQAYDDDLTAIAGLTSAADKGIQFTGAGTASTFDLTTAGKALLDDVDASAQRTTLGLAIGSQVQAYDDDLTAIAGLTSAADKGIQFTGAGTASTFDLTTAGKALLDDVDASAQRTTLGLAIGSQVQAYDDDLTAIAGLTSAADKGIQFTGAGTASTFDLTTAGKALLDDVDASAQRTTLGLAIGSQVQAYDDDLTAIAGLTSAADKGIQFTGAGTAAVFDLTTAGRALLDDASAADQRTTLGLTIGTDVQAHNEALNKVYKLYTNTTTNSNTVLTTNGESVSGSNILIIPPYAAWNFNIQLVARSNQANSWNFRGCLHRRNDGDTVYIVNSVIEENNLESSVSASVVADNSGKALELNVTGLSSTTIAWVATVHITESIWD